MLFINLKREVLPDDLILCELCGDDVGQFYWKLGWITVKKRATHLCCDCHRVVVK